MFEIHWLPMIAVEYQNINIEQDRGRRRTGTPPGTGAGVVLGKATDDTGGFEGFTAGGGGGSPVV
jgi:hypothetical protein